MKPLFSVGEEVILQSEDCPEYNGECVVTEVTYMKSRRIKTGERQIGYVYKTTTPVPDSSKYWREQSLRKKPKPSDKSFNELMKELNSSDQLTKDNIV